MIGLYVFVLGIVLGLVAQYVNVVMNYESESSLGIILWSFAIIIGASVLFYFVSVLVFGVVL